MTTVVDTKARLALEIWTHLAVLVCGGGGLTERGHLRTRPAGPGSALPSPAQLAVVPRGPGQLSANSRVNIATSCSAGRAKRPHRSRCVALLLHFLFRLTFKWVGLNGEKKIAVSICVTEEQRELAVGCRTE